MIYLNLTTKKKKLKARKNYTPSNGKKITVCCCFCLDRWLIFYAHLGGLFIYHSFTFPPSHECSFFSPLFLFLNTKYRVVDLLHRLTFALVPSLKSRRRSLMKLIFICFASFVFFFSITKKRKKYNLSLKPHANKNYYKLRPLTEKKINHH